MSYTYGMKGAPAVGGGVPGLPQRSQAQSGVFTPPNHFVFSGSQHSDFSGASYSKNGRLAVLERQTDGVTYSVINDFCAGRQLQATNIVFSVSVGNTMIASNNAGFIAFTCRVSAVNNYVILINPDGTLAYAKQFSATPNIYAICIDDSNNVYINVHSGTTTSVAKITLSGVKEFEVRMSTDDISIGKIINKNIAVAASGNIYSSTRRDLAGDIWAYIRKLSSSGASLAEMRLADASAGAVMIHGIVEDEANGHVYVVGTDTPSGACTIGKFSSTDLTSIAVLTINNNITPLSFEDVGSKILMAGGSSGSIEVTEVDKQTLTITRAYRWRSFGGSIPAGNGQIFISPVNGDMFVNGSSSRAVLPSFLYTGITELGFFESFTPVTLAGDVWGPMAAAAGSTSASTLVTLADATSLTTSVTPYTALSPSSPSLKGGVVSTGIVVGI